MEATGLIMIPAILVTITGIAGILYFIAPKSKYLAVFSKIPLINTIVFYGARELLRKNTRINDDILATCANKCNDKLLSTVITNYAKYWCPPRSIIPLLEQRNRPELVILLRLKGCDLGERTELVDNVIKFLAIRNPQANKVIAYCGKKQIIIRINDENYDTDTLPEPYRSYVQIQFTPLKHAEYGPRTLISWGCPGLDLRELALQVLPEAYPSISSLNYHLGIENAERNIIDNIEKISKKLKYLIETYQLHDTVTAYNLSFLAGIKSEPIHCDIDTILVTDKPKYACNYYSPYFVNNNGQKGPARPYIESLRKRRGNPIIAAVSLLLAGKKEIADELVKSIDLTGKRLLDKKIQIEPWYIHCVNIRGRKDITYNCLLSEQDCRNWKGPGPYEDQLKTWGIAIEKQECSSKRTKKDVIIRGAPKIKLLNGTEHAINVPRAASLIVKFLEYNAQKKKDTIPLIITPDDSSTYILKHILNERLRAKSITSHTILTDELEAEDFDVLIVSWDVYALYPEVFARNSPKIALYPERYPAPRYLGDLLSRGLYDEYLQASTARITSILGSMNAIGVTTTLRLNNAKIEFVGPKMEGLEQSFLRDPYDIVEEIVGVAERLMKKHWNPMYSLKPYQYTGIKAIMLSSLSKKPLPVSIILPTGAGKSAIFQLSGVILSRIEPGYVLVVSPLRALMRDQIESLQEKGFVAVKIDSSTKPSDKKAILEVMERGLVDFVYVTPERFYDQSFVEVFVKRLPSLIVLDEAHTISKWGTSFRPSYLHAARTISEIYKVANWPPITLFTASASSELLKSILNELGFQEEPLSIRITLDEKSHLDDWNVDKPLILRAPSVRPNLVFQVKEYTSKERHNDIARTIISLSQWASSVSDPWLGIVFTSYVKSEKSEWANVEVLAEAIEKLTGIKSIGYHGQLSGRERREAENLVYRASRTGQGPRIIVATKAFGMGMDIPNIRWILHATPSDGVEDYYQEVGRAGRDGLPSRVVSLYHEEDFNQKRRLIQAQRLRLSNIITLYNTVQEITEKTRSLQGGGLPLVVLPNSLLGGIRTSKSLDLLQSIGKLDYWQINDKIVAYQVPKGEDPADYLSWYMYIAPDTILTSDKERIPGWKKIKPAFYSCGESMDSQGYPIFPITVKAGGRTFKIGNCKEWTRYEPTQIETISLIQLSLDTFHQKLTVFDAGDFLHLSRLSVHEIESFDQYWDMMKEAVALNKLDEQDSLIKEKIDEYLSSLTVYKKNTIPGKLLFSKTYCSTLKECLNHAAERIGEAERVMGSSMLVTIAVQKEEIFDELNAIYLRRFKKQISEEHRRAYRRVLGASRRGLHKLLDYGYIVLIAKDTSRIENFLERIRGYPYMSIYLYLKE
ncbi:MAG: DEAD/DEAH box helicase [Desulfurococcales archaeon]|nr:DEAD/DEAH box helicase [Desulfurococcales archaeon]